MVRRARLFPAREVFNPVSRGKMRDRDFPGRQAFSRFTAPRLRFLATPALEAQRYRIVEHRREQSRPMVLATSPSRGSRQGTYTIAPSLASYTFSPTSQSVTVTNANVIGVNFTATETTVYLIEEWMNELPFTQQIDLINGRNYPLSIRIGAAVLVKMQVTYGIYLNYGPIQNNPNPGWQIAMVGRQQAQTPGFATIYASAPLLPNPVVPPVLPW